MTEYTYGTSGYAKGLPIKKVIKDGNTVINSVEYTYNSQLQVSSEKTSIDISKNVYAVKEYEYDSFNNITEVRDYGTGNTPAVTIAEYDLLSRKTAEYSPNFSADKSHGTHITYYPSGAVKNQTDALGNKTSFKYDAYGNVTEKTNPDGKINLVEYDGLQREKAAYFKAGSINPKQILTETSYEFEDHNFAVYSSATDFRNISYKGLRTKKTSYITADKQVITETLTDFRGNPVEEKTNSEVKRTSAYYANGQLAKVTDALNNTTTYEYNYLNKLTKTVSPVDDRNSEVISEYDKLGNLIKTIQKLDNNKNSVTVNKYNAMGLLEKVVLGDGTANGEKNITKYFYNNAGIQTKMYTGMSSENDDTYLTTEYEYDEFMRLVRTTDSTGYNSGTVTYDLNGNVLTSTDANGNVTTNTYDALNRVLTSNTVNPDDSSKNVSKTYIYESLISSILKNEKYVGDALMQKTYTLDCITHKVVKNKGERPMFLVTDHHDPIVDRDTYNRVQQELARRSSKRKISDKTITEQGKYSSKYALTELLICGHCGTPYRRTTWATKGKKQIVWRCISRLEHGKKYCPDSPTIKEENLHRGIIRAINNYYCCRDDIARILKANIGTVLECQGQEEILSTEKRLKEIDQARNNLVELIASGGCDENKLDSEFAKLYQEEQQLNNRLEILKSQNKTSTETQAKLDKIMDMIEHEKFELETFDNVLIRKLIECVKVLNKTEILVIFKGGYEVKTEIE